MLRNHLGDLGFNRRIIVKRIIEKRVMKIRTRQNWLRRVWRGKVCNHGYESSGSKSSGNFLRNLNLNSKTQVIYLSPEFVVQKCRKFLHLYLNVKTQGIYHWNSGSKNAGDFITWIWIPKCRAFITRIRFPKIQEIYSSPAGNLFTTGIVVPKMRWASFSSEIWFQKCRKFLLHLNLNPKMQGISLTSE